MRPRCAPSASDRSARFDATLTVRLAIPKRDSPSALAVLCILERDSPARASFPAVRWDIFPASRHQQPGKDVVNDLVDGLGHVDDEPPLVLRQGLKRLELGVEQRGGHEVARPTRLTTGDHIAVAGQVRELDLRTVLAQLGRGSWASVRNR